MNAGAGVARIAMAAGQDTVHFTADSVLRGVDALAGMNMDLQNTIQSIKAQLQDLAATLVDFDDLENVSGMSSLLPAAFLLLSEIAHAPNDPMAPMQQATDTRALYKPTRTF